MRKTNKNSFQLIGRIGHDVELEAKGGQSYARLSLAEEYQVHEDGEWQSRTNWWDIVCFGKTAEALSRTLKKGRLVCVSGRLELRHREVEKGVLRTVGLVAEEVTFLA